MPIIRFFLACIGALARQDPMNASADYGIHVMMAIRFRHSSLRKRILFVCQQ